MSDSTRSRTPSHGYWQAFEQLADESFVRRLEQEQHGDEPSGASLDVSRRGVLQLMSASVAMASLSGCRWPVEEIVPFDRRPESYQPGKITRFATSLDVAGVLRSVVVSSYDGRPIKIDGNPDHPASGGATDALTQANILELYDRDRSRQPIHRGRRSGPSGRLGRFRDGPVGPGVRGCDGTAGCSQSAPHLSDP